MPNRLLRRPPPPWHVTAALAVATAVIIGIGDYFAGPMYNVSILQSSTLLIAASSRNRRVLWLATLLAIVATFISVILKMPHPDDGRNFARLENRGILSIELLLVACILHLFIATYRLVEQSRREVELRAADLQASNVVLEAREKEIASQNEELQSQTEELERQGEELRFTNDELARREKKLEALLLLSRSLSSSTSRSETMDKICHTLGGLVNGPQTATAIVERHGNDAKIICHHGFAGGLEVDAWPFEKSFAALILERGRCGYLEDVDFRQDLVFPRSREGPRLRAVLAVPLHVAGRAAGTLEVYHTEKHQWSDEQITLIESLAAQTAVSLESAEFLERIEDERRRLQTVLGTVPFGVMIATKNCEEIRVNPAGAALLNVPPDMKLDEHTLEKRWKMYRDGKHVESSERPIARACMRGELVTNEEYDLVFATGRRVSLLVSAAPIHGRNGELQGAVSGWAEISQMKALQSELDARRREAEENSVRKSRFLAAVSHDIRTPANAISLLAELMQRTAATPALFGEIPEIANDLRRSAVTLVDLVSDVLDLTRFDAGRVDIQETNVSLNDFIQEECRQLAPTAKAKGVDFTYEPLTRPIVVCTDRVKLSRVLTNIVTNAIKFTERGCVTVSAGRSEDGGVHIKVTDTGCGIASEHLEQIFDEFFQLRNFHRDRAQGSGLGLAICRRLLDAMGGSIRVESRVDEGSTFTIQLPASRVVPV